MFKSPEDRALKFDPALMRSAPAVSEASIELLVTPLPEGNARLRIRLNEKIEKQALVIQGGAGPTLLRDDGLEADERSGDGIYSAFVHFDAEAYEAELERRSAAARKGIEVPIFKNRTLIGKKRVEQAPIPRFRPGDIIPLQQFDSDAASVDPSRELLVTDVRVVDDPSRTFDACSNTGTQMGAWTFGKLLTEMANEPLTGINPSDFTLHWLRQWDSDLVINGFTVPNRSAGLNEHIINPWPKLADGRLDLAKAPFRLLAIVNRIDLRGSTAYGSGDAGEARLVFGLIECDAATVSLQDKDFLVIVEYGIKKSSCSAVRDWAEQWQALGSIDLGSPAYNAALQAITDQFTLRDADPAKLPNRSALNQLRSNEFRIARAGDSGAASDWEVREFKICSDAAVCNLGRLEETTIAQTPDITFQSVSHANRFLLRDFINSNDATILAGRHVVPLQLPPAVPFRAGAIAPSLAFSHPDGVTNLEARHIFSLATCNGCHARETSNGGSFTHIRKRNAGSPSTLSDFLTGLNQPKIDPVSGVQRTFHELLDRQVKLAAAANLFCGRRESSRPEKPAAASAAARRESFAPDDLFPRFAPPAFVH